MKKLIFTVLALVAFYSASTAQEFKKFSVGLGALYAIPSSGDSYKGGAGFYLEPHYKLNDNIAAGLRMEWAVIGGADKDGQEVSVSALGSYLLTGEYYFSSTKVRPFAGAGLGLYTLGTAEVGSGNNEAEIEMGTKFGFAPRVGVLLSHFRLGLEYNVITGLDDNIDSRNYLAIKAGFDIGGGKK
ncbi:outer membrane beta-barrel protein [Rapidithrix thailandica]|uniref:Outer membrane beta-barrel protein n=1 Tax=Rapidithrix thailandica TaxID=413964 RepID=A0AAW9SA13_9BACT